MARTNKYATVNFNEIFEKKKTKKPSSSSSSTNPTNNTTTPQKTYLSTTRTHGGMLVLNRPSPKPQLQPQPSIPPSPPPQSPKPLVPDPDQTRSEPVSISLRPLGRTGSSLSSSSSSLTTTTHDREPPPLSKPEAFVPPHLRPGFVRREERFGQDGQKNQGSRSRDFGQGQGQGQGQVGSPNWISEDRRPKSGGGYERMQRGGDSDLGEMNRPNSSGNRPSSGGWYGSSSSSSYRSPPHY